MTVPNHQKEKAPPQVCTHQGEFSFSETDIHDSNAGIECSPSIDAIELAFNKIRLFKSDDLYQLRMSQSNSRDQDSTSVIIQTIDRLSSRGEMRFLGPITKHYRENLTSMSEMFPNFREVIDYVRCCAEIAWHTDQVLRFTPILLSGPGGVGKTKFVEVLANWCTTSFHRISIATSQSGSRLAGSSAFWSNAAPGMVFNALVNGDFANPLFFLDEIDKTSTDGRYDALGALYVLLEQSSAKSFVDECYDLPLDASHIMYIAACNDPERIPAPLRTRFREFEITLSWEQSRKIAVEIARNTLENLRPVTDGMSFSEKAIDALATMTPRKISQTVLEAVGRAFADNIKVIEVIPNTHHARRIGFLP